MRMAAARRAAQKPEDSEEVSDDEQLKRDIDIRQMKNIFKIKIIC